MLTLVENDTILQGSTALMSSAFDNLISLSSRENLTSISLSLSLPKCFCTQSFGLLKLGSPPSCRGSAYKPLSPANTVVCYSEDIGESCEEAFPGLNGMGHQSGCLRIQSLGIFTELQEAGGTTFSQINCVSNMQESPKHRTQSKVPLASVLGLSDVDSHPGPEAAH